MAVGLRGNAEEIISATLVSNNIDLKNPYNLKELGIASFVFLH